MSDKKEKHRTKAQVLEENEQLHLRLEEAEQTIEAIRHGEVDALVVLGPPGEQIYTLTGAEHVYRVIVETMNEAALMVDPDGTILFSNQRFCDLMRTSMRSIVGHGVTAFAARPQQPPLQALLKDAQAGPVQRHLTLQAADGTVVPVQLAASLLQSEENKSICLVATDLTELEASANSIRVLREHQQALEASEARFRAIFESSQDAVVIASDEGIYVQANPAVQTIFGLPPEELIGWRVSDFQGEGVDFSAIWETLRATGTFRGELPLVGADGQLRYVEAYGVANILPGRHLVVIRDITERKRAQEALLDANEQPQVQAEELRVQSEELRVQTDELRMANEDLSAREEELRAANEELTAREEELRVTNEALAKSEQRLRLAQQAGRVGVFDRDLRNNTAVWTPELEELFGVPVGGFEGKFEDWAKRVHPEDLPRMVSFLQEWVQSDRTEETWEYRFIRGDGQVRWMEGKGRILRDPNGKPLRMIGTNADITERKHAEEALRARRAELELILNRTPFMLTRCTRDLHYRYVSRAYAEMIGRTPDQVAGKPILEIMGEEGFQTIRPHVETVLQGQPVEYEAPVHFQGVGPRFLRVAYVPDEDEQGHVIGWIASMIDISERKQAEEALRASEDRYHRMFEDDLTGDFISTPEGRILVCNPAFARIFGFASAQEAVGTNMLGLYIDPGEREALVKRLAQREKIERLEVWRKRRDGEPIYVVENLVGHFNERGALYEIKGYTFDDTERKRAEEALRKSEEKFAKAFWSSPIAVAITRLSDGHVVEVNEAMLKLLGFSRDEVMGRTTLELGIWVDVNERDQAVAELSTAGSVRDRECRLRTKDGGMVTIRLSAESLEFGGERCMLSTAVDVTERKRAEESLRQSEERLKRAQAMSHLGSWELDLANDRLSWSDEVYRIFGLQPQEFGASYEAFLEAVHPDDRAAVDAAYTGSLREGRDTYEIEHRIVRRSTGEVRIVHEKCEHIRDTSGRIVRSIGMVHDITERKRAEEALRDLNATLEARVAQRTAELEHRARQLQKLALELSQAEDRERKHLAEILHDDLQQQLAAAKFHLGMLSNRVKYDPVPRSIAGQVDHMLAEAIEKSRSLSHELSPAILYHGDLGEALEWLAGQMQTKYGLAVHVDADGEVDVESDALKVFLFRSAQELLFNVVKHARVNAARIRVRCMGHCLCLCVSDRGRGFDPQDLKATAGFGLLSIRERVELLGGRMRIRAAAGKGSTFFIAVPDGELSGADLEQRLSGEEADGRADRSRPIPEPRRPRLRVLLADDHEIVREGLAVLLNDQPDIEIVGQAANGREAVDLAYQLWPDVVVMDVAMPLMGGDEATRQIKLHMPKTRVIGLSMYEEDNMAEKMHRAGAEAYLLKTGPAEELLAAIRGEVALSK